jgi:hypothetical protein
MRSVRRPGVLCCMVMALAASVLAQTLPLNPTVKVFRKPQSIVPPECEQGLAPAAPLPPVEEAPAEVAPAAAPTAPPTSDLRTRLRRVQTAAESENYDAFKSALADARAAVNAYPAGGEKQSANDVLQIYSDLERLWDYQQTSPTGAFFTAQSDDIVNALRKYPGFSRAVADATMTVGGQTIYPSRETRQFLTDQAARRLGTIGIRTPMRAVQTAPPPPSAPKRKPPVKIAEAKPHREHATRPRSVSHGGQPPPAVRPRATTTHATTQPPAAVRPPATTTHATTPAVSSGGQPPPAVRPPATTTHAPAANAQQPPPAVHPPATTTTAAPPSTETTQTTETTTITAPPPPVTTTTAASTSTTTEATPATTSSAAPTAPAVPAQAGGMNLTFAIILIVVGIGVLIVLFRASD